jgi:hypothetical protein
MEYPSSMGQDGFFKRLAENILGNLLSAVVVAAFGGAALATGLFVIALPRRFEWISAPARVLLGLGVFLLLLAFGLSVLPRLWRPVGPFGRMFGTAPMMMGFSEERNKQVFLRAPRLRTECQSVAKQLYTFVDKERKGLPSPPANQAASEDSPEKQRFNADMQAYLRRFTTLYHSQWRRKVEPLFVDARAMFFGPVPPRRSMWERGTLHPDNVYEIALALDRLSQNIPLSYTASLHEARVDKLRRLKQDGLSLSVDLGQFLVERHRAAVALQPPPGQAPASEPDPRQRWQDGVNFSQETEALFTAEFGGLVVDVLRRLDEFGLSDESLARMLAWGAAGLRVSSYDIGGLAGTIAAVCQQIPYD